MNRHQLRGSRMCNWSLHFLVEPGVIVKKKDVFFCIMMWRSYCPWAEAMCIVVTRRIAHFRCGVFVVIDYYPAVVGRQEKLYTSCTRLYMRWVFWIQFDSIDPIRVTELNARNSNLFLQTETKKIIYRCLWYISLQGILREIRLVIRYLPSW